MKAERAAEKVQMEEREGMIQKLKQSMRASASHHENNTKRMRERVTKVESEKEALRVELEKYKNRYR